MAMTAPVKTAKKRLIQKMMFYLFLSTLLAQIPLSKTKAQNETDLYTQMKTLQKQLELLVTQEEFLVDETRQLSRELRHAEEEIKRAQATPLQIGRFLEMVDGNTCIIIFDETEHYVHIMSTIDRERLRPQVDVALHRSSHVLVDVLPLQVDTSIGLMQQEDRPNVTFSDVGGLEVQKQEIREAVELPLSNPELYRQVGVVPPRGLLLYGPPGTGKTMLARAVAHHTSAAFIHASGSQFIQKYLGEGVRQMRSLFQLAEKNAPAIIFIDEVDAIATARFDALSGADREVQRILLELLNQMDGFDQTTQVIIILATNRVETLDRALLRPGRVDRMIQFNYPNRRQRRLIFQTCTANMNLSDEVDLEDFSTRTDPITAADIHAICQNAGMRAIRNSRFLVLPRDLEASYKACVNKAPDCYDFQQ